MERTGMNTQGAGVYVAHETEEALLGCLLAFPELWSTLGDQIHIDLWTDPKRRTIFSAGDAVHRSGMVVDMVSITQHLRRDGALNDAGGAVYVAQLATKATGTASVEQWSRILAERLLGRRITTAVGGIYTRAAKGEDALTLLDELSNEVSTLGALTVGTATQTAADGVERLVDVQTGAPGFLRFGIPEMDRIAVLGNGLPYVFAGRPGIGKSILAVELMWRLTEQGPVLLFTPEMTPAQVQARILARESGVPYSTILRAKMSAQEREDVARTAVHIADRMQRLKLDATSNVTPDQVRARVQREMKRSGIIAFGMDHLHEMKTGHPATDRNEFERVSLCMGGLTGIAKATNLPAIIMAQLSRQTEGRGGDKRPKMADLRGSGAIEEKAAFVGLLYRAGYYEASPPYEDTLEVNVAKNRDGSTEVLSLPIIPALSRIGDRMNSTAANSSVQGRRAEVAAFDADPFAIPEEHG